MDSERWKKLDALFCTAVELAPSERAAYVERECGDDMALRAELEAAEASDAFAAAKQIAKRGDKKPGFKEILGVELPLEPKTAHRKRGTTLVWLGPDEWLDILHACRTHPSVVIYCCGNEELLDDDMIRYLEQMATLLRELVPDALFNPQEAMRGVEYFGHNVQRASSLLVDTALFQV